MMIADFYQKSPCWSDEPWPTATLYIVTGCTRQAPAADLCVKAIVRADVGLDQRDPDLQTMVELTPQSS